MLENTTINPAPPLLSGLTWRPVTRDDLGALVKLADECELVDGGLALMNEPGNLRDRYFPDAPGCGIGVFASAGRLVACTTVHIASASDTERATIVGQVQPEWRNRGIGTYLMRWSQAQAGALFQAGATEKRLMRIAAESLTEPARRLYDQHGFKLTFEELVMQRNLRLPLPDCPMPPGVSFTAWQPDLADQFFQAYQAAFRERPGFPGYTSAEWITNYNEDENFKHEWSLLARTVEGLPVGFVMASTDRPGSRVIQVGVIPEQRRRGLASALIIETMRRMQSAGASTTGLEVNLNNPGAIQTYITLGFETAGRRARFERTAG